jgi:hypothetical protein
MSCSGGVTSNHAVAAGKILSYGLRVMPRFPKKLFFLLFLALVTACGKRAPRQPRQSRPLPPPTPTTSSSTPQPEEVKNTEPAGPQLSDSERKASARALYSEGVQLQERADCAKALPRFESAQRLYDAPTHVLHIAQCQAMLGRLIEAQENYATLHHLALTPQSPDAFKEAQGTARAEMARLKPRIPTLRIETNPPATALKIVAMDVNGTQTPADLIGVARPMNPGRYRVTINAGPGRTGVNEVELKEGEAKSVEVRLSK